MTIKRAAAGGGRVRAIIAGVGSLAVLVAVVLMLWPPEPDDEGFTAGRGESDGETVGWVSKVESNTIHVNSGPFGGGVVPLVVTKATRIRVGTQDGWFENIRPGGQVKVAYELYHGRRFARTVELLVDEGPRRPVRAQPQLKSPASASPNTERAAATPAPDARGTQGPAPESSSAKPWSVGAAPRPVPGIAKPAAPASGGAAVPAPVGPAGDPAVKQAAAAAPVPPPAAPAPVVAKPAAPTPPEARPAARPETPPIPAPSRSQPVESVPAPPAPTRQVSAPDTGSSRIPDPVRTSETPRPAVAPPPAEPARSTGSRVEGADGSAAVDWLLQNRR